MKNWAKCKGGHMSPFHLVACQLTQYTTPHPPNPSLGKALPSQVSMFTSAKLIRASTINHGEHLSWTLHFLCSLCQLQLLLWLLRLHIFSKMCFFLGCLPWHVVVSELFYQQHLLDSSLPDALVSRSRLTMHNLYLCNALFFIVHCNNKIKSDAQISSLTQ